MQRAPILAQTLSALVIAGCTQVGPDFQKPDADINAEWELLESQQIKTQVTENIEWWHAFNDSTLNNLVDKAYAQNLSLEAAGLRVLEARAQLGIAVGSIYPQQQTATGSATYTDRSKNAPNTAGGDLSYWQYNLGLNIGWELDFWGAFPAWHTVG